MIGLGSNRLTVCRRGGMSVTQAGRGGMEWLAGGRGASWASPYSAQATAALKAQFPTQWPTIRDYGFAHPEIVGYMNAYAPEDAKIAYSLVPTLGVVRWLIGNGTAVIDTGIILTSEKVEYNVRIKDYVTEAKALFGAQNGAGNTSNFVLYQNSLFFGNASMLLPNKLTSADSLMYVKADNGQVEYKINGVSQGTATYSGSIKSSKTMVLFAVNSASGPTLKTSGYIALFECVDIWKGVPFIHKDNGTDKYGMIDLLTGTFYPDATGNNGFTISETPS